MFYAKRPRGHSSGVTSSMCVSMDTARVRGVDASLDDVMTLCSAEQHSVRQYLKSTCVSDEKSL